MPRCWNTSRTSKRSIEGRFFDYAGCVFIEKCRMPVVLAYYLLFGAGLPEQALVSPVRPEAWPQVGDFIDMEVVRVAVDCGREVL
mmetsp:Transcript_98902/g.317097  ORF Transcript_98902/g.317097 Transcript_98902/m.317097 type:complete len:85 (+) Transcript_98902:82-336(+)